MSSTFNDIDVEDEWVLIDYNNQENLNEQQGNVAHNKSPRTKKRGLVEIATPTSSTGSNRSKPAAEQKTQDCLRSFKEQGNAEFRTGRYKEACALYTKALQFDPDDGRTHILYGNRSNSWHMLGEETRALEDAKMCVKICPVWAKGYHRVAVASIALGRHVDAVSAYEAAVKLEPNNQALRTLLKTSRAHALD